MSLFKSISIYNFLKYGVVFIFTAIKSLNNNLVLAIEGEKEFVLFGKGIGFQIKKGDFVESSLIEKIFYTKEDQLHGRLEDIDPMVLQATEQILRDVEDTLAKKLNPSALFFLADHIDYAIQRTRSGIQFDDTVLQWEIPFLYYKEHELAQKSISLLNEIFQINLPPLEASLIALHFVNAQDGTESMSDTMLITKVTKRMVQWIETLFVTVLDKDSLSYSRFVIHIRHFMNRQLQNRESPSMGDDKLYGIISEQYPKSYACGLVIRDSLQREYQLNVGDNELVFLMIHIQQLVSENK